MKKYIHMHTGEEVLEEDAIDYVGEKCGFKITKITEETKEFTENIIEWYFSGNWIEREYEEEDRGRTVPMKKAIHNINLIMFGG